jgi:hypothetical protein
MQRVTQLIAEFRLVTHELTTHMSRARHRSDGVPLRDHFSFVEGRSTESQLGDELGAMGAAFCGNWDVTEALRAWLGRWRGCRHWLFEPVEECVDR